MGQRRRRADEAAKMPSEGAAGGGRGRVPQTWGASLFWVSQKQLACYFLTRALSVGGRGGASGVTIVLRGFVFVPERLQIPKVSPFKFQRQVTSNNGYQWSTRNYVKNERGGRAYFVAWAVSSCPSSTCPSSTRVPMVAQVVNRKC